MSAASIVNCDNFNFKEKCNIQGYGTRTSTLNLLHDVSLFGAAAMEGTSASLQKGLVLLLLAGSNADHWAIGCKLGVGRAGEEEEEKRVKMMSEARAAILLSHSPACR